MGTIKLNPTKGSVGRCGTQHQWSMFTKPDSELVRALLSWSKNEPKKEKLRRDCEEVETWNKNMMRIIRDDEKRRKMAKLSKNKHNWAWIGADEKYEYTQCQWPSCRKIKRSPFGGGKSQIITLSQIPRGVIK